MEEYNNNVTNNSDINSDNNTDIYVTSVHNWDPNVKTLKSKYSDVHSFNSFSNIDNHIIVNTRNASSSESNVISLNKIDFNPSQNKVLESSFYNLESLNKMNFNEIYNIIYSSQMLIFIDNYKIKNRNKCFCRKKNLLDEQFYGCTFFPFEFVSKLNKDIHILNNQILNAEFKNIEIRNNNDICFSLCFDDGEINKNSLYKKLEINNIILFVPIKKYQLKLTEYRIRGFCQIVEELGAKQIEITFKKNNTIIKNKNIEASVGTNIEMLAGGLGLSINNSTKESENYKYTLKYPDNNTITLNEKALRKKIKHKKFIISEDIFNSNLELQYVIRSRCRHFITQYSTIFTFDNSKIIDKKLLQKFKSYNINTGIDLKSYSEKTYYLQIITDVIFSNQQDYMNNLFGYSVSLDKIGFSFLINSIKGGYNFETNGVYKIMEFINLYIFKVLKHNRYYSCVLEVIKKIKKNITIKEYSKLLCNYFDETSQWIHFNNFIDLLAYKTHSYDKLGYLLIMNNNNLSFNERFQILVNFIQEKCIEKNIEDKFWKMLQPQNKDLEYFLINKLVKEYEFIEIYNWYDLNCLISNINDYCIDLSKLDPDDYFKVLKKNMRMGYKYYEFKNNMIPFIIKRSHIIHYKSSNTRCLSSLLKKLLNYESFIVSSLNSIEDLDNYILDKIKKIESGYKINDNFKNFNKSNTNELFSHKLKKFKTYIKSKDFKNNYSYFNKKLNIIIPDLNVENSNDKNLYDFLNINKKNFNEFICEFFKKLLCYNEKLNLDSIPINDFGFNLINERFNCGVKQNEFIKIVKPFINKLIINIIKNEYTIDSHEYNILRKFNIFTKINLEYFENECNNYYNLILNIKNILQKKTRYNMSNKLLSSLII